MEYKRINLVDTSVSEGLSLTNTNCKIDRIDDGTIIITQDGLYGVVDIYNRQLLNSVIGSIKYFTIEKFYDGIAIAKASTGEGLINRSGEEILEPIYSNLTRLYDNVYRYGENNKYGLIEIMPTRIFKSENEYSEINVVGDNCLVGVLPVSRNYLIDKHGRKLSKDYHNIKKFKDGYAQVVRNGKVGIINIDGREILEPIYDRAIVEKGRLKFCLKNKWGLCDLSGFMMIEPQYESIDVISNQLIRVRTFKRNNPMGIIDCYNNNAILPCKYKNISIIDDRYFWVSESDSRWYKIDLEGNEVGRYSGFCDNMTDFEDGLAVVYIDGNMFIIDSDGKQLIKSMRSLKRNHNIFEEMIAYPLSIFMGRNYYCFDKNNNYKRYQSIKYVDDNVRIVNCDSKYGLINKYNEEIVKPQFDSISDFVGEYAIVSLNDQYGVIDKKGSISWLTIPKEAKLLTIKGNLIKYQVLGNDYGTINSTGIVDVYGNEILSLIDNESVHILNNNLFIIDNVLIPVESLKIIYRGVIERQTLSNELEKSLEKDFETPDSRERFFASFEHDMEVLIRNYMYSYPNDKNSFQKKLK